MEKIGLLFSGQGSQHIGMGKSLYENFNFVKDLWDKSEDLLKINLKKIVFEGKEDQLKLTYISQPVIYIHSYSIYMILKKMNLLNNVQSALGLSLGELTALCVAGVYNFETGLKIVYKRGILMHKACTKIKGGMASILGKNLNISYIKELCKKFNIEISIINSPQQIVVSGVYENILNFCQQSKNLNLKVILLKVAGAYHSSLMSIVTDEFKHFLTSIKFKSPFINVYSNINGDLVNNQDLIKLNLVKQITSEVNWFQCMKNSINFNITKYFECGPNQILKKIALIINPNLKIYSINEYKDIKSLLKNE